MTQCVNIDGNGFVVASAEVYPACSSYVLITPAKTDKLTYWAEVGMMLDDDSDRNILMAEILLVFIIAFGIRQVFRLMTNR